MSAFLRDFQCQTMELTVCVATVQNTTPGVDPRKITPATVGAPVKDDGVLPPEPKGASLRMNQCPMIQLSLSGPRLSLARSACAGARDPKAIWTDEEITGMGSPDAASVSDYAFLH